MVEYVENLSAELNSDALADSRVFGQRKSLSTRPGAVTVFLPRFPMVPAAGKVKPAGLNQWAGDWFAVTSQAAMTLGRSASKLLESSARS